MKNQNTSNTHQSNYNSGVLLLLLRMQGKKSILFKRRTWM